MSLLRTKIIRILASRLERDRFNHALATEKEAARLAAHYHEDWHSAALAGLLHDLCRCHPQQWQSEYMRTHRAGLSREWLALPKLWHGPCAAAFARAELGIRERKILDAVRFHTTSRPGMSTFEKIIYIADKIEPTRSYEGVHQLRAAAHRSLDEALHLDLKRKLEHSCASGLPLVNEATAAYNELATANKEG